MKWLENAFDLCSYRANTEVCVLTLQYHDFQVNLRDLAAEHMAKVELFGTRFTFDNGSRIRLVHEGTSLRGMRADLLCLPAGTPLDEKFRIVLMKRDGLRLTAFYSVDSAGPSDETA